MVLSARLEVCTLDSLDHATRFVLRLNIGLDLILFKLSHVGSLGLQKTQSHNSDGVNDYFCMNQECPHAGGPMEDSQLEYDVEDDAWIASCPWHSYDFNVKTGESSFGMKTCTYPVLVKDGKIFIDFTAASVDDTQKIQVVKVCGVSEAFNMKSIELPKTDEPKTETSGTSDSPAYLGPDASLTEWCTAILNTPDPEHKIRLTHHLFDLLKDSPDLPIGQSRPPATPPRTRLTTIPPNQMPKLGRAGTVKSRIAILHSLANIEQWAIDLALDICARFSTFVTTTGEPLPRQFFLDWIKVANDEAKHFSLLRGRLEDLGSYFGELPVHHGLWDSAEITSHDLRARISIIALVHEARGLDVNPATIKKFENAGDDESVAALRIIHNDEVTHVTTGHRWLTWICAQESTDPVTVFRENVTKYFAGAVKGPWNVTDREAAGLDERYYKDLNGRPKTVLVAGG